MENNLKIVGAFLLFCLVYQLGVKQGYNKASTEWGNSPEGYCLADKPPHPGACK